MQQGKSVPAEVRAQYPGYGYGRELEVGILVREENNDNFHYNHTIYKGEAGAIWGADSNGNEAHPAYIASPFDFSLYRERP